MASQLVMAIINLYWRRTMEMAGEVYAMQGPIIVQVQKLGCNQFSQNFLLYTYKKVENVVRRFVTVCPVVLLLMTTE